MCGKCSWRWLADRACCGAPSSAPRRRPRPAGANLPALARHAHASHAIDRGATLPEVQATLGHGNIMTTSGYLRARPESSSGLKLDPELFLR